MNNQRRFLAALEAAREASLCAPVAGSVFGFNLATEFTFVSQLAPSIEHVPSLVFLGPGKLSATVDWRRARSIYPLPVGPPRPGQVRIFALPEGEALRFRAGADFLVTDDCIACLASSLAAADLESLFLGPVLSYWLERQGFIVLHACGIALGDQAIALLAPSGVGKSSLGGAFVRRGHRLIADDILPVQGTGRLEVRPGLPQLRLWPEVLKHFGHPEPSVGRDSGAKRRVRLDELRGSENFCLEAVELGRILVLEREPGAAPSLTPMAPAEALVELVRHSFLAAIAQSLGWQPRRLETLARIVDEVEIARLRYPTDLDRLDEVVDLVIDRLGSR